MKIAIFDMDGTLIDTQRDITASINHVRQVNHNLPPLSTEFVVKAINAHQRNLAELFYHTPSYEARDKELFEKHYDTQCIQTPELYEGVEAMLHTLKDAGVKLAVATNAPSPFAKKMLFHLGVGSLFELIVGADMVTEPKPAPLMIEMILEHLKAPDDAKVWMIGDNSKDMLSAKNAGVQSVFVTWGFSQDGVGDFVVKYPSELLSHVLDTI